MILKFSTLPPAPCTQNSGRRPGSPRQIGTSGDQPRGSGITFDGGAAAGGASGIVVSRLPACATSAARPAERGALEQRGQRQVDVPVLADACEQPHRRQRVAAQREEVVVAADLVDAEQLAPRLGDHRLDRIELHRATPRARGSRRPAAAAWARHRAIARRMADNAIVDTTTSRAPAAEHALEQRRRVLAAQAAGEHRLGQAGFALGMRGGVPRHRLRIDAAQAEALERGDRRTLGRVQRDVERREAVLRRALELDAADAAQRQRGHDPDAVHRHRHEQAVAALRAHPAGAGRRWRRCR